MVTLSNTATLPALDVLMAQKQVSGEEGLLHELAVELLEAALGGFARVRKLDEHVGEARGDGAPFDVTMAAMLRVMYEERVQQAEQVLKRIDRLEKRGMQFDRAEQLRDEVGRTMAMLSISLEDMISAAENRGTERTYTIEELRHELQDRRQRQRQADLAAVGHSAPGGRARRTGDTG